MIKRIIYSCLSCVIGLFLLIFPSFLNYFNSDSLQFDIASFLNDYPVIRFSLGFILLVLGATEIIFIIFVKIDKTVFVIQKSGDGDFGSPDLRYSFISKGNRDEMIYTNLATIDNHSKAVVELEKKNIRQFYNNLPKEKAIAFLAVATMPSLVYAGYIVGESGRRIKYFHWSRNKNKALRIIGNKHNLTLIESEEKRNENKDSDNFVICVSTSYLIDVDIVKKQFYGNNIMFYQISNLNPNAISTRRDLLDIASTVRSAISKITKTGATVHLLLHCSSELCFAIGQKLNSPAMPKIKIYNFNAKSNNQWDWYIELN